MLVRLATLILLLFHSQVFTLAQSTSSTTAMGTLASQMQPGTWAELQTNGLSKEFLRTGQGNILQFSESGVWDPISKHIFFTGKGQSSYTPTKFIMYSDATNTWSAGPLPPACAEGFCKWGHAYDHNAIDPTKGDYYYRAAFLNRIARYNFTDNRWVELPQFSEDDIGCCAGLTYFPEMNGLVLVSRGTILFFDAAKNRWLRRAKGFAMGGIHNIVEYNPVHKLVVFGGGNKSGDLYKMDTSGTITKLKNAPLEIRIAGSSGTLFTVDPTSGKYIVLNKDKSFYEYDVILDNWTLQNEFAPVSSYAIAVPISTYGVIMFMEQGNPPKVYLYKHAPGRGISITSNITLSKDSTTSLTPGTSVQRSPEVLHVGPGKQYGKPSQAAAVVKDGDTVEIDAGIYEGDAAIWQANNLTIRGIGGRAHLKANGAHIQGKSIWITRGRNITIENIEFSDTKVRDRNGAGIRHEGTGLTLRNCYFHDNEMGILTKNNPEDEILIEYSEFANNGTGNGRTHNIYISKIKKFTLRYSFSHNSKGGQLVKTRAQENHILYNRLIDEGDGTSNYEIDLSNGGVSYIVGNLIRQSPLTENSVLITHAPEGATNPSQELYIINNTLVNDRSAGIFVKVTGTPSVAKIVNNLFVGNGTILSGPGEMKNNLATEDFQFVDKANYDYHLKPDSAAMDGGTNPGTVNGVDLTPVWQYVHPLGREQRIVAGSAIDIGAYEFNNKSETQ
jgi:hypothetical protein